MKEQIYQDVKNALQQLADALGIASENLWAILVRQQMIEAITYSLFLFATIISGGIMLHYLKKENDDGNMGDYEPGIIIAGVCFVIFLIVNAFTLEMIFTGFFNPEFGAFQEIQKILK